MDAQTLLQTRRKEILAIAARNGAVNVRVFGSVARGENRPDSDIDFLEVISKISGCHCEEGIA